MSATLNQHQPGNFSSNIMHNPKNDTHCLAITTQNGKSSIYPPMYVVDKAMNDFVDEDETLKAETK